MHTPLHPTTQATDAQDTAPTNNLATYLVPSNYYLPCHPPKWPINQHGPNHMLPELLL